MQIHTSQIKSNDFNIIAIKSWQSITHKIKAKTYANTRWNRNAKWIRNINASEQARVWPQKAGIRHRMCRIAQIKRPAPFINLSHMPCTASWWLGLLLRRTHRVFPSGKRDHHQYSLQGLLEIFAREKKRKSYAHTEWWRHLVDVVNIGDGFESASSVEVDRRFDKQCPHRLAHVHFSTMLLVCP